MKKTTTTSQIPIHDINLSAFLAHRGVEPELLKEGSRVVFCFPNDETTYSLMQLYNRNPPVSVLDYVGHLRRLRAQMLSMRDRGA
jgi:hypothetical protein